MRALLVCSTALLAALLAVLPEVASAQMKLSPKATAPGGMETRYFTSIDGLMDGNADVILKETRQGKTVTAAVLDVCYPVAKNSDRKDRFVVNLQIAGQTLSGTTSSLGAKAPVTVKLTRKPTGDTFEFRGQIGIGQAVTEVTSPDNADLSEKEFLDNQTTDDGITPQPKDFTEVSPEAIAVKVKLDNANDFLKSLKGQDVEVTLASLTVGCDALRAGEQTINMSVDPERSAALLAKFKAMPGVTAAGWTAGLAEMDRTIRIPAADWRDGDKINRNCRRAEQDACGQAGLAELQRRHRQAQARLQAAEPGFPGARAYRHDRGLRPRLRRQAGHDRQADRLDRQPLDHDRRREQRGKAQRVG
jgi:hypothetical protein